MKKLSKKIRKIIVSAVITVIIITALNAFLSFIYVPPILMYHSIDERENETKLSLSPESFKRQMEFFHRNNYSVISLDEMVNLIKKGKKVPHKTITITFDDGYENNYLAAYPVLKEYNFPAAIFVITGKVGEKGYLSWAQIKEMQENNITIGSHTKSHLMLEFLATEKIQDEVSDSKDILQNNLNAEIKYISYPVGSYNAEVEEIAKKAGYTAALGTNPGPKKRWNDLYALKRVRISRTANNLFYLWIESSGYYTFIKEARDDG